MFFNISLYGKGELNLRTSLKTCYLNRKTKKEVQNY